MNFYGNSGRMRGVVGQNTAVKKQNKFNFQKNLKTPLMQHRFVVPQPVNVGSYCMVPSMKTSMLNNDEMSIGCEVSGVPYDEGYISAMETDAYAGDCDFWDSEAPREPENVVMRNEDNRFKRKNSFPYSSNENLAPNTNKSAYVIKGNPNTVKSMNDSPKFTGLKQSVLCTDTPSGLGFKIKHNENAIAGILKLMDGVGDTDLGQPVNRLRYLINCLCKDVLLRIQYAGDLLSRNTTKVCPKWSPSDSPFKLKSKMDKDSTFPRVFTVTVEKLQTCPKVLNCGKIIFELFGILEKVWDVQCPKSKKIQLKSQKMKNRVMCTFYEIDRPSPELMLGHWLRCIVLLRYNKEFQCLSIRPASANELKFLDKLVIDSSKSMAMVLKSLNEPKINLV